MSKGEQSEFRFYTSRSVICSPCSQRRIEFVKFLFWRKEHWTIRNLQSNEVLNNDRTQESLDNARFHAYTPSGSKTFCSFWFSLYNRHYYTVVSECEARATTCTTHMHYMHYLFYLFYKNAINAHRHGSGLQGSLSVAGPSQFLPPLAGSGLSHSRFLVLDPWLHGLLQFVHKDQLLQLPWTTQKNRKKAQWCLRIYKRSTK